MSMIPGGKHATHTHPEGGLLICLKRVPGLTKKGMLKKPYYFQIAPLSEFGWESQANFTDYEVVQKGQYTRGGARLLRTISFQSMVLSYNARWAVMAGGNHHRGYDEDGGAPWPREVAQELDEMLLAVTPLRLIVWNKGLDNKADVNWVVTFRSFATRERGGEPDSRYFDFSFTEDRRTVLRRTGYSGSTREKDLPVSVQVDKQGVARELKDHEDSQSKEGKQQFGAQVGNDKSPASLRDLAQHYYGESNRWRDIALTNGIGSLGPDETLEHLNFLGRKTRVLTIPAANGGTFYPGAQAA